MEFAGTPRSGQERDFRLGRLALERGFITPDQLRVVLVDRVRGREEGRSLGAILVNRGYLQAGQRESLRNEVENPPARLPGQAAGAATFGKFHLKRELGRGGMGVVYEAEDTVLRRTVALKILNPACGVAREVEVDKRFTRESNLAMSLPRHPHVVPVYETGEIDKRAYLSMELIAGKSMGEWQKSVPAPRALAVLRDVALGVHHIHTHGIIHRDLKPGNVLIRADETPVVTDFGLAKIERTSPLPASVSLTPRGLILGSPGYMSPEQARGQKGIDHTTDIYSLGVMLFEILTGRRPFIGKTPMEVLSLMLDTPVPRPSTLMRAGLNPVLFMEMEGICMKALSKNSKERYFSARMFADALSHGLAADKARREKA